MLEAIPVTGRTNQIRVHLHYKGLSIVGDKIYALTGALKDECLREGMTERVKEALILDRHALHAGVLEFEHPATHSPLRLEAPLPDDFRKFLVNKALLNVLVSYWCTINWCLDKIRKATLALVAEAGRVGVPTVVVMAD